MLESCSSFDNGYHGVEEGEMGHSHSDFVVVGPE